MTGAPFAPWVLRGEAIVVLTRRHRYRTALTDGLVPLPGPALIVATRFTASPVGPYLRLAVAEPARLGMRPGWCLTTVVVDDERALVGERLNWGMPAQLGSLRWVQQDDERELEWRECGVVVHARGSRPTFPFMLPFRSVQQRGDGPVVVPGRIGGRARPARVEVTAGVDEELGWTVGRHRGLLLSGVEQIVHEARQPIGFTATLLAPNRAPEPVLRGNGVGYGSRPDAGAYSSVG